MLAALQVTEFDDKHARVAPKQRFLCLTGSFTGVGRAAARVVGPLTAVRQ